MQSAQNRVWLVTKPKMSVLYIVVVVAAATAVAVIICYYF